jgi:hypothetical protein
LKRDKEILVPTSLGVYMGTDILDPKKVLRIIDHPTRRAVIEAIGRNGPLQWKTLADQVGERTGSLYHHLDVMEKLVFRDKRGRYVLTPLGTEIYSQMATDTFLSPKQVGEILEKNQGRGTAFEAFAPRVLLTRVSGRAWPASFLLLFVSCALMLTYSKEAVWIFSVLPTNGYFLPGLSLIVSTVAVAYVPLVVIRLAFGTPADPRPMLVASSLSLLPFVLFGMAESLLGPSLPSIYLTVVLVILQAWVAGVVGAGASVASGLRIERTLLVSLILVYASVVLILFNQSGLAL